MSYHPLHRSLRNTVLAAAVLLAVAPSRAAVDLDARMPVGPQVKVGKLPNGLTYYIQRNGKPEHRLELRLVVKAGSVLEDDDQKGLAHFTEHLAFNGSTHFKQQALVSYLQSIGLKLGADLNAMTSYDETTYMLPVPTNRKEDVDTAFTILEDWAHGLTLLDADIDKERTIVLEELRLRKGLQQRVQKVVMPKLFAGSRYPERDPSGTDESIRTFKPETLRRFYRDWYRPDLMAIVAVGDIDPAEAERQIRAHFGKLANPVDERARVYDDIRSTPGTEAVVLTDAEMSSNIVTLHYPVRYAPDPGTYRGYRDKVVEGLFTGLLNLRLAELGQAPTPPFIGAGVGVAPLTTRHKAYTATAVLGAGGSAPALAALLQEQARVRQYGFSDAELERGRKLVLAGYERGYNERTTTDSARYAAEYTRNFLAGETIPGIEAEYRLVQELLPGIGADELKAFAERTLSADSGKLVLYLGGTAAPAPNGQALLADVDKAEHAQVAARTEKQLASRLMDPPAQPGRIVAETSDAVLGTTRLTLSNGVQVVLKPTAFNKEQVLLRAQRNGGQMLFDEKDIFNARFASTLVATMGLKDFTPLDLGKVLAGRSAGVDLQINPYTDEISGTSGSSAADVESMLQMLWQRFAGVRRDEALYRTFMDKQRELLRNRMAQPEARFGDTIVDTLYAHHPYEPRVPVPADLDKVDLDRSIAIYRARFGSARGLTFFLVGDFDVARLKPLLAAYLGTLPTPDLPLAYRDVGLRFAKGVVRKKVEAGVDPKSVISLTFSGPAAVTSTEHLRFQALVEILNLRTYSVLREKLGLLYGGGLSGEMHRLPYHHYTIGAMLPTGPENVAKVEAALLAEIARLKADGPEPAELEKVKQNWRQGLEQQMHDNGYWLNELLVSDVTGTDPHEILTRRERIDAITPADIQRAARQYLDTDNYVQVVLNPQKGAVAKAGGAQ